MEIYRDSGHTGTECLYCNLFGKFPEKDCPGDLVETLRGLVMLERFGGLVVEYFCFGKDNNTRREFSEKELARVRIGLEEAKQGVGEAIRSLFDSERDAFFNECIKTLLSRMALLEAKRGIAECNTGDDSEYDAEDPMTWEVADLSISTRARNSLIADGILTVRQLVGKKKKELEDVPGLGPKSRKEIIAELEARGLSLVK